MMRKIFLLVIFIICLTNVYSQIRWPSITQEAKPWTRWWWQGSAVNKKDLSSVMELYKKAGLGGLEITPIYGVKGTESLFIDYLSPRWVEMLTHTLSEARRLGLGIDMATGTGWPFGGPWVKEADACKYITWKTWALQTGESLSEPVIFQQEGFVRTANGKTLTLKEIKQPVAANSNMQEMSIDQVRYTTILPLHLLMAYDEQGKAVNLTSKVVAGKLNWTAPTGKWKLVALFQGLHGKMVERAAPGGEGNVIDHFNSNSLKNYLAKFNTSISGKDLSSLRCFFNDSYEVDDARGQSNWTPEFLREFRTRRGYNLENELATLVADSSLRHRHVLYDYRKTISDLLLEKFTRPWFDWAHSKGKKIRNQSHGSPANILDLYSTIDIPETEGNNLTRFKFATSAANVMGKRLASAEASTWLNEHFMSTLADVKKNIDQYFIGGVNHLFYHGTNYSPLNDPWPGWLFYAAVHFTPANPFWKDFKTLNDYVTRCQSFLQTASPDNDVLLYFPFHDRNYETARGGLLHHFDGMEGFEKTDFNRAAEEMLREGFSWDLISDKQIQKLNVFNGKLKAPGGNYQTILLSGVKYLPYQTLAKLLELTKQGARVLFHRSVPASVPGLRDSILYQKKFDSLLSIAKFSNESISQVYSARIGKGLLLKDDNLLNLLAKAEVRNEQALIRDSIAFIRKINNNAEYYFLVNNSSQRISKWISLSSRNEHAILFEPMIKKSGVAMTRKSSANTLELFVQLDPAASCVVQTSSARIAGDVFRYEQKTGEKTEVKGRWQLQFLSGGPGKLESEVIDSLVSWTELPFENSKYFSGTAQYSINFKKPGFKSDAVTINLGRVSESASIELNGQPLGTLIGPVYEWSLSSSMLKDDNVLKVTVTNGMANRVIDLDRRGLEWKKFYNINMPARLAANRGADGLFTSSNWKPFPSGLLGPVTLEPVNYKRQF